MRYWVTRKEVTVRGKRITLTIPPGIESGKTLRIRGQGESFGIGMSGDLLVDSLCAAASDIDTRWFGSADRRENLYDDRSVRGVRFRVKTLTDDVDLKIPPGAQPGQQLRLRGRGGTDTSGRERGFAGAVGCRDTEIVCLASSGIS